MKVGLTLHVMPICPSSTFQVCFPVQLFLATSQMPCTFILLGMMVDAVDCVHDRAVAAHKVCVKLQSGREKMGGETSVVALLQLPINKHRLCKLPDLASTMRKHVHPQ